MAGRRERLTFNVLFWVTQLIGCVAFVLLCIWIFNFRGGLAWSSKPKQQFNWHALAMPLALVHLCALEIMIYRAVRLNDRKRVKNLHAAFAIIVLAVLVLAYWTIIQSHIVQGKNNWFSLHSWLGTLATVFYVLQGVLGFASFLWPGMSAYLRSQYMPIHVFIGLTTLVLGSTTSLLGMFEEMKNIPGYNSYSSQGLMMNFCGVFYAVFTIMVVYIQTQPQYRRESLINAKAVSNGKHVMTSL